jgi:hypothetical protein
MGQFYRVRASRSHLAAGINENSDPNAALDLPCTKNPDTLGQVETMKTNPFPGMNPFLERHWSDVHTKLIAYIADSIAEQIPPDLTARSDERVTLHKPDETAGENVAERRADVAVVESWKRGLPPRWNPAGEATRADIVVAEPRHIPVPEETERWIEIRDANGRLITVIEVLSPRNKGPGASDYRARQDAYIRSGVNLVEIDLLRGGAHVLAFPLSGLEPPARTRYLICVTRATNRSLRDVYPISLREALPNIRIPLRPHDPEPILQLQPLIDRAYRMGGYWSADHDHVPDPPLSPEDADWVAAHVREARSDSGAAG